MARATFEATLDAIYRAAGDFDGWTPALEQVADHVGGAGAMLVYNDLRNGGGFMVTGRLRKDLEPLYLNNHVRNPWNLAIEKHGPRLQPFLAGSLLDRRIVHQTAFHADILAPQKISDQIILRHPALSQNDGLGGFAVQVTNEQLDDASVAITKLRTLTPHLARALDLSVDVERYRDEACRMGSLLQAMPMPAMLLDCTGRMVNANAAAERTLRSQDGLTVKPGMFLKAAMPHDDWQLRSAIAQALHVAGGGKKGFRLALSLQRQSGLPPFLVLLTPLPRHSSRMMRIVDPGACVLVKLIDPVGGADGSADALREAYKLTAAEARVAELIAAGLSTPEIAAALNVSASTVRTHLAACFDKTGLHSQVTLARLVGSIGRDVGAIRELPGEASF